MRPSRVLARSTSCVLLAAVCLGTSLGVAAVECNKSELERLAAMLRADVNSQKTAVVAEPALRELTKCRDESLKHAATFFLGRALLMLDREEEALRAFEDVDQRTDLHPAALANRSAIHQRRGRPELAEALNRRILTEYPDSRAAEVTRQRQAAMSQAPSSVASPTPVAGTSGSGGVANGASQSGHVFIAMMGSVGLVGVGIHPTLPAAAKQFACEMFSTQMHGIEARYTCLNELPAMAQDPQRTINYDPSLERLQSQYAASYLRCRTGMYYAIYKDLATKRSSGAACNAKSRDEAEALAQRECAKRPNTNCTLIVSGLATTHYRSQTISDSRDWQYGMGGLDCWGSDLRFGHPDSQTIHCARP